MSRKCPGETIERITHNGLEAKGVKISQDEKEMPYVEDTDEEVNLQRIFT